MNTPETSKKKRILKIGLLLGLVGALYFGYSHFFYITTDNAQIQANTVILTPRVGGFVTRVNVIEGQSVKKGEILVEIDSKDYQSKTRQSENELASLGAKARDAELNFRRIQTLFDQGAVSQQQKDSAYATFQELLKKEYALRNQLEITQSGLADTQIRAPSDGIIAKKSAEPGMLAAPGTPLLGFVASDSRWIVANFKETDLNRLRVGQKATIEVDAISGKAFEGEVETFYPATGSIFALLPPDNATGNFTKVVQRIPTRIRILNLKPEDILTLKAGLSAVVEVRVR